ncbi:MAG: hypothetical protein PUB14_09625 [Lachnospiraceae bacterium]|nr:hypothetical protein [Lachnospiraceae bacterium]
MPIATSRYWNMAWLLKSIEAGKKAGITIPEQEKRISTNFIGGAEIDEGRC